jgi:hypothetical protein
MTYSKKPGSPPSGPSSTGSRDRTRPPYPRWIFRLLWGATLVAAGAIAFANVKPYINIIRHLGLQVLDKFILRTIANIPIVNALASAGIGLVSLVCGVALWSVFQVIEVLPVILYNHAGFLEEAITEAESGRKYQVKNDEDPTIRVLKETYNKLPVAFLENLGKVRAVAYVLDFLICFWSYSPVRSGLIGDFFYVLATGQWSKINWSNLLLALTTLFGVEVAVMLLLWVGRLAFTVKKAAEK